MIGETVSHYRILRNLGSGGMGIVYEAQDLNLKRHVALKFLPHQLVPTREALQRFRREAESASALNHPNICTIYEIDEHLGRPFISMELLKGAVLKETIGGKPMDSARVLELGIQIADALEAAHAEGIIHRDIKPGNIFVTDRGQSKLLDFGLARQSPRLSEADRNTPTVSAVEPLTKTGLTMGTLGYMSPEQARGKDVDSRTDLFSLGVVLYEMLTGTLPFPGETTGEILEAVFTKEPVPARQLNPNVPQDLDRLVTRAMEKDRNRRYQTAAEVKSDLQQIAAGMSLSKVRRPNAFSKKWFTLAALPILILIALVAFREKFERKPDPVKPKTRIAVLPFTNMSGDTNQEYFSDGLTEELLNVLARNSNLQVISRTSAFSFKGKDVDIKTIAEKLNVTHVVEGSVRKADKRLRVTAQLIEAASDSHVWSRTYDREMANIFAIQDEIAAAVSEALHATLETGPPVVARKTNPEAYNAYLQGRYFQGRPSKENLQKAIEYFERALKLDSNFTRARVGLATAYIALADWGYIPGSEGYGRGRSEIEKALAIDSNLGEAYAVQGWIQTRFDWDWAAAEDSYKRALQLQNTNTMALGGAAGLAATLGRFEDAMKLDSQAIDIDPLRVPLYFNLGSHAFRARKWTEAKAAFDKVLELNPQFGGAHMFLGFISLMESKPNEALEYMQKEQEGFWREHGLAFAYHAAGKRKEADDILRGILKQSENTAAFQIAEIFAFRGETKQAFEWLERAYQQRDSGLTEMKGDPMLQKLERDPRFKKLLKRMNLPE